LAVGHDGKAVGEILTGGDAITGGASGAIALGGAGFLEELTKHGCVEFL
jgi:hypothetical protein